MFRQLLQVVARIFMGQNLLLPVTWPLKKPSIAIRLRTTTRPYVCSSAVVRTALKRSSEAAGS